MTRAGLACGLLAPAAFITAWVAAGAQTLGYSMVQNHISDLARTDASHRLLMTAGFVIFGLLLPLFALALAPALQVPALRLSVGAAGLSTLAVAAFPVDSESTLHAVSALLGYVATAASPALAAGALPGPARAASYAIGGLSAVALIASVVGPDQGLWQRTGLSVVDLWYAAVALILLRQQRRGRRPHGHRPTEA